MKALFRKSFCLTVSVLALTACAQQAARIDVRPVSNGALAEELPAGGNLYDLGKSDLRESKFAMAIDTFRQDLRLNGDSVKTLNGLGVTYDMLGRYDLSQKYYERALEIDPTSSMTLGNLAYSQYKQGDLPINAGKFLAYKRQGCSGSGARETDKKAGAEKKEAAEALFRELSKPCQ